MQSMVENENNSSAHINLKDHIREVQDWPCVGVSFKDITTVLENREAFRYTIDEMTKPFLDQKVDKIVVIDARGFLLGTAMAYRLNCGVSLVRKKGKLPSTTISESSVKEYGADILEMHDDTIKENENVVIVDDILATGGTAEAAAKLVEREGGEVIGMIFMVNLPFLGGSERLSQYNPRWLVEYDSE